MQKFQLDANGNVNIGAIVVSATYLIRDRNKELPADPTLPLFIAPINTLTTGKTVPASAVNSDGTMNFDDIAWWPVV